MTPHTRPAPPARERIRAASVEVTQLHTDLSTLTPPAPQRVLDNLADSHHYLMAALAALREYEETADAIR